jgi:hypothetical protein
MKVSDKLLQSNQLVVFYIRFFLEQRTDTIAFKTQLCDLDLYGRFVRLSRKPFLNPYYEFDESVHAQNNHKQKGLKVLDKSYKGSHSYVIHLVLFCYYLYNTLQFILHHRTIVIIISHTTPEAEHRPPPIISTNDQVYASRI